MRLMLDGAEDVSIPGQGAGRRYALGSIPAAAGGKHFVSLCQAGMGNNVASIRASRLLDHFPQIEDVIMVGIAGGVPKPSSVEDHVRLGDIVVSDLGGVVQYDFVKDAGLVRSEKGSTHRPSALLIEAVRFLEAEQQLGHEPWRGQLARAKGLRHSARPPKATDRLSDPRNPQRVLEHPRDAERDPGFPKVFRGVIASANAVLKDPQRRDELGKRGVRAIEMEGSGIVDATWTYSVGYLVVRGICDYCNALKNDLWQGYASVVAAAYVRALLESMPVSDRQREIQTLCGTWHGKLESDWVGPSGRRQPPIEAYLVIRPASNGLSCSLMTVRSRSKSLVAVQKNEDDGTRTLIVAYENQARASQRMSSPTHHGVMQLTIPSSRTPTRLQGGYWTDRKTMGDVTFTRLSEGYFEDFETASRAARAPHSIARGARRRKGTPQ